MSKPKYKIRYEDTMTSYLLDGTFDSEEDAEEFIDENFFEGDLQFYVVEPEDKPKINHDDYPDDVNYKVEQDKADNGEE